MLRADLLAELPEFEIVEIGEVAGGDADRADAKPRLAIIDAVEIDQPLERLLQRRGVVVALRLRAARRPERRRRNRGVKKPGTPKAAIMAALVSLNSDRARSSSSPGSRTPATTPSPRIPSADRRAFARVAGDDRGIDGADRDACDPFRLEIKMAQRLIGAGLIGAERAAALQNQHALALSQASWLARRTELSIMTAINGSQ